MTITIGAGVSLSEYVNYVVDKPSTSANSSSMREATFFDFPFIVSTDPDPVPVPDESQDETCFHSKPTHSKERRALRKFKKELSELSPKRRV